MMAKAIDATEGVLPLSALDSQSQELIEQVRVSQCPLVVTKDGQPAVVLIEARAFEEQQQRLALMERIIRGEKDLAEGRTHTQEEVEALLDEWLGDGD
jgi:prevent-host-death family protein